MDSTFSRLFGAGEHGEEVKPRDLFGRGFVRSRSPSPEVRTNPLSWDECAAPMKRPPIRRSVSPYAYSPTSHEGFLGDRKIRTAELPSTAISWDKDTRFLGVRKNRTAEPPSSSIRALLSPPPLSRVLEQPTPVLPKAPAKMISNVISPHLSPRGSPRDFGVCATATTRKNFPEKRATCGVTLGMQLGSPKRHVKQPEEAFDHSSSSKANESLRARFYSPDSSSFVARRKHFTPNDKIAEVMQPERHRRRSDGNIQIERDSIPLLISPRFHVPHTMNLKAGLNDRANDVVGRCSNFRSSEDSQYWKGSKHMMKKMFHDDTQGVQRSSCKSQGVFEEGSPPPGDANTFGRRGDTTRSKRAHCFHSSQRSMTDLISNTLRQREHAQTSRFAWRP